MEEEIKIKYIGGELISSDVIPIGTIGVIKGTQILWENGIIGRYNSEIKYKQIEFL